MPRGPEPKKPRPAWSTALRARRVALDLRQEDVAARTEDAISQGTVSDLERGKVDIANLTATRLGLLAQALDWSIDELQAALGLRLTSQDPAGQIVSFLEDNFPGILSAPGTPRSRSLVKPRLPEVEVRLEVPSGLQEAIEKYGDDYPELHLEANQRALTSLHRYGGANDLSSKEWFEVFMANRRWLVRADDRN